MKKAQILSAIALAFALGVVAPIAAVNAADDGISAHVDTGATTSVASVDNLKSAVNYVTSNATYKAFNKWAEAKAAAAKVKDVDVVNGTVKTQLANFDNAVVVNGSTVDALISNTGNLKTAIGTNYDKYVALVDAMNANAATAGSTAAIDGVATAMRELGYTFNPVKDDDGQYTEDFDDIKTAAEGVIDSDDKVKNYSVYANSVAAVKDATATFEAFKAYQAALQNGNLGLSKNEIKTVNGANTIATLNGVTPADATNWNAVIDQITNVNNAIKNASTQTDAQRYQLLDNTAAASKGLLQLMQTATDNYDLTYAELISAPATDPVTGDTDNSGNTGTGDNTNAGEDDKNGITAGDQGVLANAEGNASASAGIMAAVATALTAAGVGVVAFRNARRSSKKA